MIYRYTGLVLTILISLIVSLLTFENQLLFQGFAEIKSNFTSTQCSSNSTCITTTCINNQPCYTVKSNSTTSTSKNGNSNSTDNGSAQDQFSQIPNDLV